MPLWLRYSLITIILFGFWGFVSTVVTMDIAPLTVQVLSTIGLLPVAFVLFFSKNLKKGTNFRRGIVLATATGVLGGSGNIAMYKALQLGGEGSAVIPFTGMYPLVTVILARFLLKEKLNRIQSVGIVLALGAIYLFSPRQEPGRGGELAKHDFRVDGVLLDGHDPFWPLLHCHELDLPHLR